MKLLKFKSVQIMILALLLGSTMQTAFAQVYKVVDKDGNVSYTDTPPKDGSKAVDLPPISVIETPEYQVKAKSEKLEDGAPKSLRALRSEYRDFAIISPTAEDSIWAPEQTVTVSWSTAKPLLPGMMVRVAIDGVEQALSSATLIAVPPLDRGEHTVDATLLDDNGKVISKAQTVTFYVRQPNLFSNPNHIRPKS